MKKILMLCTGLTLLGTPLAAITHTNKTFLMPRSIHSYLSMRNSTFHRLLKQSSSNAEAWGGHLQAAGFYSDANNRVGLGEYFGTFNKSEVTIGQYYTDIDHLFIFHRSGYYWEPYFNYEDATSSKEERRYTPAEHDRRPSISGTLKLHPKFSRHGVLFTYQQDLDHIYKKVFVSVDIPLMHVATDIGESADNNNNDSYTKKSFLDYFSGCYAQQGSEWAANLQDPLTHAKLDGPHSSTGIADIKVALGYKIVERENYELNGAIHAILPTSSAPDGKSLFEPVVGNGDHWGLGFGLNGSLNIYRSDETVWEFLCNLEYTFLFKSDEVRTLGYRQGLNYEENQEDTPIRFSWEYYWLGGQAGVSKVFPLANVLTRDLSVSPGGQVSGYAAFSYHRNNVTFDFGYSFFAREGENITVKSWPHNTYGLASAMYITQIAFDPTQPSLPTSVIDPEVDPDPNDPAAPPPQRGRGSWILANELDPNTPATPAALVHAIHGALGYTMSDFEYPIMLGCGFSVDWNQDNAEPIGYMLWAKTGIAF